jgi:hypothetical protein
MQRKSGHYEYHVVDGRPGRPCGFIGTYCFREAAQAARAAKCRMGGYIKRSYVKHYGTDQNR